jgi:NAD(P)-dependent dehydrogenase (short-subunit alcohol dehydrogenase family)
METRSKVIGVRPLEGKVAVVLGARRGIGKGVAVEAAIAGATVYATGRTAGQASSGQASAPGSVDQTVAEIAAEGGEAVAVRCDASDDEDLAALYERIRSERGRLDLVVHSAFNMSAFSPTIGRPIWELPATVFDDLLQVGARAAYVSASHAAPFLIDTGGGLVVHISGRGAGRYRYNVVYGVDKAAIDKLTADLAHELRPHGVAVVSLWPSVTRTERNWSLSGVDEYGWPDPTKPSEELETPRYTGRAVVALASDPEVLARTGRRYWTAELAASYGFTDENGRTHPVPIDVDPAGAST